MTYSTWGGNIHVASHGNYLKHQLLSVTPTGKVLRDDVNTFELYPRTHTVGSRTVLVGGMDMGVSEGAYLELLDEQLAVKKRLYIGGSVEDALFIKQNGLSMYIIAPMLIAEDNYSQRGRLTTLSEEGNIIWDVLLNKEETRIFALAVHNEHIYVFAQYEKSTLIYEYDLYGNYKRQTNMTLVDEASNKPLLIRTNAVTLNSGKIVFGIKAGDCAFHLVSLDPITLQSTTHAITPKETGLKTNIYVLTTGNFAVQWDYSIEIYDETMNLIKVAKGFSITGLAYLQGEEFIVASYDEDAEDKSLSNFVGKLSPKAFKAVTAK